MSILKAAFGGLFLSVLAPMCLLAQDTVPLVAPETVPLVVPEAVPLVVPETVSIVASDTVSVVAREPVKINIYWFVLGIDVPESPALVALNLAPRHALLGSAPKPIAATLVFASGDLSAPGVAIDIAPYFLFGGGVRELGKFGGDDQQRDVYRSMSFQGRATRVLTKTLVSLGVVRDPSDPSSLLLGVGVRPTFHDPHDPIMRTTLPDSVVAILQRRCDVKVEDIDQDVIETCGVDLSQELARVRSYVRRYTGGVAQFTGGWGMAGRVQSGILESDSLGAFRHNLWFTGQYTRGPRIDVLTTLQIRNAFQSGHSKRALWIGAGIQRKTTNIDFSAELYFDTASNNLHPGLAVDVRILPHVRLVTSLTTSAMLPSGIADTSPRRLEFRTLLRLFAASDH